jgi:hypothetical protein
MRQDSGNGHFSTDGPRELMVTKMSAERIGHLVRNIDHLSSATDHRGLVRFDHSMDPRYMSMVEKLQAGPAEKQPEAAKEVTLEVQVMKIVKQMQQDVKEQLERIERATKSGKKSDSLEEQTGNSDEPAQDLPAEARANLRKGEDDVQNLRREFMALSPTQREEALRDLSYGNDMFSGRPVEDGHITILNEAPSTVRAVSSDQESRDLMMELLKVKMQKLSQCQQAMRNAINTMHENAMNPIRNIKP